MRTHESREAHSKETARVRWLGASAAALVALLFPYEASAVGFHDFSPGDQSRVIQVADSKGAEGGDAGKGDTSSASQDASEAGADATSPSSGDGSPDVDVNAPDVDVNTPDVDVSAPDVDVSAPDVDVDAPDVEVDTPDVDADTPDVDADAPDVDTDTPDVDADTPDVNAPGVDAGTPDVDVSTPDVDVDTPDVDVSTPDVDVSTPAAGSGTSSGSAGSAPQGQLGATPAGSTASAEIHEAPSGTILVPSGRSADAVEARLTTVCFAGDPKCAKPGPSPAPAPAAPAATGVWPPQSPPPAQPVAPANESPANQSQARENPLAISLVSPIKARDGLVVQGIIVNESGEPQAVPPIQINLVNKAGQTLQQWTIRPPVSQLPPGQNKAFKTVLQPIPADVARADAAFLAAR